MHAHTHMILNTNPMPSEAFAPDSGSVPSDYDVTRIEPGTGLSGFRAISESGIPRRALNHSQSGGNMGHVDVMTLEILCTDLQEICRSSVLKNKIRKKKMTIKTCGSKKQSDAHQTINTNL